MRALYPGSFDPLTNGHMDLIERAAALFGQVTVAVLSNPNKKPAFSVDQRIEQIRNATRHLNGIDVVSFDGLTVHCAATHQADLILRGLRAMSDFEYELQIAHTNRSLAADLETVFLATSTRHSFLSSSVVKEVARFGGPVDHMVPKEVAKDLNRLFNSAFPPR
ncbi:MAG: pantetheine-phosphate adenylyltransferase [Synechococcus sp. MED-G133]|jgi:pantetheine-phosphate adenylyltransferase|uniref:pantetheine-phosphate adenylyltransferase n=1 Tax=Synechococcus sp. A15-28 TaxID=1050638 RepID=UPI00002A04BF|nr:pantetheine-phosphate adenylyltransferase [Synechococcus sp. A15-28]MBA4733923.1 pantetheine-phosphate adenylyltransferase [Synechococcus sp.]QNI42344.1 pantetheine-phosphate adenylyltransferase [Synechococcus sp. A15-28]RZO08914.1 MAG: pantetheine-phosphate adenylyltransferase [Synechococcus sp. MED-G133]|tara:strand:+ start:737 stop:1228 length:492 start_codon:yes stop_codon:yes gene_type:complete